MLRERDKKNATKDEDPHRLNLAYQELKEVPANIIQHYSKSTFTMDLSHNEFSDLRSLAPFENVHTLILDNNDVRSHAKFPPMPCLHTLWVNRNKIDNLTTFVEMLAKTFPQLRFLSMMNNPAAPSYFNGGSYQQFQDYRQYVISQLSMLEMLDDQPVNWEERQEAERIYKPMFSTTKQKAKKKTSKKEKVRRQSSLGSRGRSSGSMEEKSTDGLDEPLPDLPDLAGDS